MFLCSPHRGTKAQRWERLGGFGINNRDAREWRRCPGLIGGPRIATKKPRRCWTIARPRTIGAIRTSANLGEAVRLLQAGKIVGWFQGAAEFGPRALGNRSLLASPWAPYAQGKFERLCETPRIVPTICAGDSRRALRGIFRVLAEWPIPHDHGEGQCGGAQIAGGSAAGIFAAGAIWCVCTWCRRRTIRFSGNC